MMKKIFLMAAVLISVSACGFQPRANLAIPASVGSVKVINNDTYSPLTGDLQRAISRASTTASADAANAATLRIYSEAWSTTPLAVDQFAQVREYITRYRVEFELTASDGSSLLNKEALELSREYTYDINVAIGNPAEQEVIQRELRRDMQASIIRRLDIALRAKN
jgi:outer membrane lipopolysaccharide assembly protein LptE/RlpB